MPKTSALPLSKNTKFKAGDIIIYRPSRYHPAGHSAVIAHDCEADDFQISVYESHLKKKGDYKQIDGFDNVDYKYLEKTGAEIFRIGDTDPNLEDANDTELRETFVENLESTTVKYSIGKVLINSIRDRLSSEKSREEAVAEKIAKYYFESHRHSSEKINPANNFCSQYNFQCLQNALVENELGKAGLGVGEDGFIPQDTSFKDWRNEHIGFIKQEVKKFPPELKHVSSSRSPRNLRKALTAMSNETEQDKTITSPKSDKLPKTTEQQNLLKDDEKQLKSNSKLQRMMKDQEPKKSPVDQSQDPEKKGISRKFRDAILKIRGKSNDTSQSR